MIVFPESLNELPKGNPEEALRMVEQYIKYMCQRTDWAMGNVTKNVSKAGVSNAEMYILLTALQNTVSALQSTVNSHTSSLSALSQTVNTLGNDYAALAGRVTTLENNYTALEQRVAALENANTEV
jgi:flagellar biosynthesis chaperone FliJ